jgi:hypothetical protein
MDFKGKPYGTLARVIGRVRYRRSTILKASVLGIKDLHSFVVRYPALAEIVLARNIVNSPDIDKFLQGFHSEAAPKLNEWLDTTLRKFMINKYDKVKPYTPKQSDPEWMKGKTDLESVVLDNAIAQKVQHIIDFLKNKLAAHPDADLKAFQADEAFKQSQEWSEKLKKKKSEEEVLDKDFKIVMDLGGGWNWVDLISANALTREGNKMGHCVGGYWDSVKAKSVKIFSLRDPKNEPHCTIEYSLKGSKIDQIKGKQNQKVISEYMPYVLKFLQEPPVKIAKIDEWDLNNNGLIKAKQGYLSVNHLKPGDFIDQSMDLKKFKEVILPKDLTINGDLKVGESAQLESGLTVTGELSLVKTDIEELPAGLKVGSLNLFGCRIIKLPPDIQVSKNLNAEFSQLEEIPSMTLTGDLTLSDTSITQLPSGLKVGGELDIMNTGITTLPDDLKAQVIYVDDPDTFEAPKKLQKLIH